MNLITIDMDALARAIYSNTDASEQEARSIINTVGFTAPAPASEAVAQSITIDFKQATELLEMFGDEPCEITLTAYPNDEHHFEEGFTISAGLYAHYTECPEEGSTHLGVTDYDAIPKCDSVDAPVQQAGALTDPQIIAIHSMPYVRACLLEYVSHPRDEEASAIVKAIAAQIAALKGEPANAEPTP
ncbi:hypothetical protein ABL850_14950 [Variovorax paradoxus]|uniref:hypothetical protein n=1 Tax=Variovorax paradoxus TaxID=34073 RepID=UPI003AAE8DBC